VRSHGLELHLIAVSPGLRWDYSMLSGDTLTRKDVMNQTAITHPHLTLNKLTVETIKKIR
jgi:sulfur-oxidizing protein SoxB